MKKILLLGLLAGAIMVGISLLVNALSNVLLPSLMTEYETSGVFRPWSDPLMSLMFVEPFILGVILAWIWDKTKSCFHAKTCCKAGILFGLVYWMLTIPGMIMSYSSFPISLTMIASWSLTILLHAFATGLLLSKMNK